MTTLNLTSDANPSVYGQAIFLQTTITGAVSPMGYVSIFDAGKDICDAQIYGTTATCLLTVADLGVGTHPEVATYLGDANNASATSPVFTQVVSRALTTTTVGLSPSSILSGQSTLVTASVAAVTPATGVPSGPVVVSSGITSCTAQLVIGQGSCSLQLSGHGEQTVAALYAGNGNYLGSSASALINITASQPTVAAPLLSPMPLFVLAIALFVVAIRKQATA
jgi:hypothetical protein